MKNYSPILSLMYRSLVFAESVVGRNFVGAQAIVQRGDSVLLIKPSYRSTWEFPGGKVEKEESPKEGAVRETKEEAGVFIRTVERRLGIYVHRSYRRHVTIHVFVAKEWEEVGEWRPSAEIAERKFFPLNELPENTAVATRLRLGELTSGEIREYSGSWD